MPIPLTDPFTAYRKQEYFRQQLTNNNSTTALWTNIIVAGGLSVTGNVYVAQEPEHFQYDADGNLTNDGRWAYTWDGENRLINMTNNTGVGPLYNLAFAYDARGRRIQKVVTTNGVAFATNTFLYDGWNLVAELGTSNTLLRNYTWGNDLSGSQQGAGGVSGLLEVTDHGVSAPTNAFVAYDGNGNVAALVNAGDGTVLANYDYGPFGEIIRSTGLLAENNPIRFSTKYQDDESDLIYYGYRYYKVSTGTWVSKDTIGELGFALLEDWPRVKRDRLKQEQFDSLLVLINKISHGKAIDLLNQIEILKLQAGFDLNKDAGNLNVFVENNPMSSTDSLGLFGFSIPYFNGCPSQTGGGSCLFICRGIIPVPTLLPKNQLGLEACLANEDLNMYGACYLGSISGFREACEQVKVCFKLFW